ncbi:MAG: NAD(P)/FAD-dependent oxidoreductase [Streptococcaceae bacterium]|jgi:protoporphyrinogen oxidase|nr:NAD(P)/FAD-dependent oxidoreductase [Streptococcaceae bacterium]
MTKQKIAIIIGAGPAGLTAAYELAKRTDIKPIVFESTDAIGGISQTVNYKGNRIDIGGHRFFSKSDEIMEWWNKILPVEKTPESETFLAKYPNSIEVKDVDPEKTDNVMLVRNRLSRIYYGRKFYDYPVSLSWRTIRNLGFWKMVKIGSSYMRARFRKVDEANLEGFYVNRFGRELYNTFFRDYTTKLWGVTPEEIDSSWGAQRIKNLSVASVLLNAIKPKGKVNLLDKSVETSLIEAFLYPKLGPGYLWETVAKKVQEMGGEIHMNSKVQKLHISGDRVIAVDVMHPKTEEAEHIKADYFFSTMPINQLTKSFVGVSVPADVERTAAGLPYRDFITVGILAKDLLIKNTTSQATKNGVIPDNWIYIQEPDVSVCRLQIFNNWSPYMVSNPENTWVGMEYVVSEKDEIWGFSDEEMTKFAIGELSQIDIIDPLQVIDTTVIHIKKAYPAYFGTYNEFSKVKGFVNRFENLYLIGRNGQHRYNNQDHSMLTAIEAVNNIITGREDKENIWSVNVEKGYHETI